MSTNERIQPESRTTLRRVKALDTSQTGRGKFDSFLDEVRMRLEEKSQIRLDLPSGGHIHIERRLPFICVYRQPTRRSDEGTERLVLGEASYLIAPGKKRDQRFFSRLIRLIVEKLSDEFGAFLLVEIFSKDDSPNGNAAAPLRPEFNILAPKKPTPTTTIEAFEEALSLIRTLKRRARVKVTTTTECHAPGLPPLLSPTTARKLNCFTMAIGVSPVYRDIDNGQVYPLVLRKLHHGISQALKKGVFEFSRTWTSHQIVTYQSLGRRALVKAVWNADRRLAEISTAFDLLLLVTPTNVDSAWRIFKKSRYQKNPLFYYRPRPVDPAILKRQLYRIPLERIEDPTLGALFREKRLDIERQLTMLGDRGSKRFMYGSLQLYGGVSDKLERVAQALLAKLPPRVKERSRSRSVRATEFAEAATKEIGLYRESCPELSASVEIRDDTVGLMVSGGKLLIGRNVKIPASRVDALLQHEIGTHVLTYFNGKAQPFHQLYCGLAGYEELQEGVAVLSEYLVGGLSRPRLRLLAGRVIAVKCMLEGASFVDTFRELNSNLGFEKATTFNLVARVYRSGGLTKDAVYLRGLVGLLSHLQQGGNFENLFVGKIAVSHIPVIEELQWRGVLKKAPLMPRYIHLPTTQLLLEDLAKGRTVLDLVRRVVKVR
jgi:uncharacterized protein (TIGR02421 family)